MQNQKIKKKKMIPEIKLYDFNVYNEVPDEQEQDSDDCFPSDKKKFIIQMFGMDEKEELLITYSCTSLFIRYY